ncbi:hypothetical protein NFJ02_28g64720 [Pycnococcus provasolii]
MDAADAPTMEEDSTWSVALARFRAAFANAPESEFAALVRDTAECYNMKEEEVVQDLAEEPLERSVRHQIAEGWEHAPNDSDPMKRLVKKSFDMAIAENNPKKNVSFVFQVRSEKQTFDTTPAILDKRSLIDGTIRDHGDDPCEDPRITPDPSANFTFKETALSRVAYEYAPGRLDDFRAAVHWAAAHHGVDIERVLLVLTTHGMFWYTSEDAHVMNTGGKKIVLVKDSSNGTYTLLMMSRARELA